MNIAISGSSGFIGKHLVNLLLKNNFSIVLLPRAPILKDLENVDVVINLAGRAHVLNEQVANPKIEYKKVNCDFAVHLYHIAEQAKVKLFIQLSSIGVLGNETGNVPFNTDSRLAPIEEYAKSKSLAEIQLTRLSTQFSTSLCIIRPPLVYGNGAKGNIERLNKLVSLQLPFPFLSIKNFRSLVSIYNLCDLIMHCITHPNAPGNIFLVSDDHTLSTADLMKFCAISMKKTIILFPFPKPILVFFLTVMGKKTLVNRLFGNLEVDINYTKDKLDWKPPFSVTESFEMMRGKEE